MGGTGVRTAGADMKAEVGGGGHCWPGLAWRHHTFEAVKLYAFTI